MRICRKIFERFYRKDYYLTRKFHVKFHANKTLHRTNHEVKSAISFFMIKRSLFLIGFNLLFGCRGSGAISREVSLSRVAITGAMLHGTRNN